MSARGVGAGKLRALVAGGQVDGARLGVVEAVVPCEQVRVGDDFAGATLVGPRLGEFRHGDVELVAVLAVVSLDTLGVGEDAAVEPQAVCWVVQVDTREGLVVGHGDSDVRRVAVLTECEGVDRRGGGVDAEVVRDRLLGLRGAVVVRGERQRVVAVGQVLVRVGAQVERGGLVPVLDPCHLAGAGVDTGLPGLVGHVRGDGFTGGVRVHGVERVDAAQGAGTRFEDRGSARGLGAGEDVAVSLGRAGARVGLDQGVVSQLLARGAVVDARGQGVRSPVGGEGVEDGGLAPVAIEAHVGHGQVGLTVGLRGEAHEAVEERAVGRVLRDVGVEGGARRDVHAHGRFARGGDGDGRTFAGAVHGRAGVGDVHALASPVGGVAGEEPILNELGERLRVQGVGGLDAGEVVEGDVEVPSLGPIPQVGLGSGGLGGTRHGRVYGRGRGSQDVRQTRALLARGVRVAGVLERVGDGSGRAHDEVLDDVNLFACAHGREQRIILDALQDDRAHARHLRGRHRRAGHELVGASGHRGVDVAAGCGDLGLEAQVGGDAPGGEARHGILRAGGDDLAGGDAQVVVGGGQHGLAVRLRNECGGHAVRRQAHDDEGVTGNVVVDDEAGGLGACDVVELGLEGEGASLDQHDLSGQALGVLGLERGAVLGRTDAAVDIFEGAAGQVGQVGHLLTVSATGPLEGNVAVADGERAVRQRVIDGGDGDHGGVGRWLALGGGVRVGREGQVLAGGIAVSGRVVVAGCRVDGHAHVLQALEDGRVDRVGLVVHTSELAERQVDDIGVQDHHVVECGEQPGVGDVALDTARDFGNDDLRVGRDADDFARVARGDAGDVRAVRSGLSGRRGVRVVIRVVVGEGELLRHVGAGLAVAQLGCQRRHLVRRERGGPPEGARERRMLHVHARVDDGDDLPVALLGDLVGVHHQLGAEVGGVLS